MALPRPSLTLILDIDESLDSEEMRLEVGRCYSHIGPTLVRTHETPADGAVENTMRFLVKMGTRRYLLSADEGADELWGEVMVRWFGNELHKVGNNMRTFNRRQKEIGNPELVFSWAKFELENDRLSVLLHCDTQSGLDERAGKEALCAMRDALNAGTLGQLDGQGGIARILMPSRASWEAQAEAGRIARIEREKAEQEEAERQAAAAEERHRAAEEGAEAAFLESPELVARRAAEEREAEAQDPMEAAIQQAEEFDPEEAFGLDDPDFAVDYAQCTVEMADGTSKDVVLDLGARHADAKAGAADA